MKGRPVALVVGGGSGIGADTVRKLFEEGYAVSIMSSTEKAVEVGARYGGYGYVGSLLDPASLEDFVKCSLQRFRRIDGVVNCTGHGPKGDLLSISDESWQLGMDYYLVLALKPLRNQFSSTLSAWVLRGIRNIGCQIAALEVDFKLNFGPETGRSGQISRFGDDSTHLAPGACGQS